MIVLAELTPLDPATGTRETLRCTNANDRRVTGLNGQIWFPAISKAPVIGIRLFKGDFDGTIAPNGGSLTIQIDKFVTAFPNARRLIWQGARVKIWAGDKGQAWPWTQCFEGVVDGDNFTASGNAIDLNLRSDTTPFEKDALTLKYAGTGGVEGGDSLKNQFKPFLLGRCSNVEPVLIDTVNNVYQFSAYAPIQAVNVLYERGSPFPTSSGDYASYTALVAATIPNAGWATCLAEGLIRLGAPQYGVITGDVDGDKFGGTWRRKTGEIVQRIASNAGVSGTAIDSASWNGLDTALSSLPNQGRIGYFLNAQKSVLECAAEMAGPCNAQAGTSLVGKLFACRILVGAGSLTLDAQQRQMPRVLSSEESGVSPPFSYIQFGYDRAWRVHTADEIAFVEPPEPGATVGGTIGVNIRTVDNNLPDQDEIITAEGTAAAIFGQAPAATDPTIEGGATRNQEGGNLIGNAATLTGISFTSASVVLESFAPSSGYERRDYLRVRRNVSAGFENAFITDSVIPVRPGETLFSASDFFCDGAVGGNATTAVGWFDATGALVTVSFPVSVAPTSPGWFRRSAPVTVPAGASFAQALWHFQPISAGVWYAATPYLGRSEMGATLGARVGVNTFDGGGTLLGGPDLVTIEGVAAAILGQAPAATDNTIEAGSDITSVITGPTEIVIECDSGGTPITLPKATSFKLLKNGSDITATATWTNSTISGTITHAFGAPGAHSVSAIGTSTAKIRLTATVGSRVRNHDVDVRKNLAPPATGGSGTGGTSATVAVSFSYSATSMATSSPDLVFNTGTGGVATLTGTVYFDADAVSPTGYFDAYWIWQRWNGSAWVDVGTETISSLGSTIDELSGYYFVANAGEMNVATVVSGLTTTAEVKFRLRVRNASSGRTLTYYTTVNLGGTGS